MAERKRANGTPKPTGKAAGRKLKPSSKEAKLPVKSNPEPGGDVSASQLIDQRIRELGGWRGETLARMRGLILEADPEMTEEWKWSNPVWSHHGIVCTGEAYTKVVKLTFAQGASIPDPAGLFNSSLGGNTRRAIDIREGESVDANAFKALIQAAVNRNALPAKKTTPPGKAAKPVRLLSGGNPQIAKADGDAPVQAYIAALPGWKKDLGERLDALIVQHVPNVCKAVKWNSPLYGIEGQGWFLGMHAFTHYLKLAFFRGASLRPLPPVASKDENTRYVNIRADDDLDEAQLASWIKQAAALPGWIP